MTSLTTNPASHRTRIVAEAVVSAYIHELAQPRRHGAVTVHDAHAPVRRALASSAHGARSHRRAPLARRRGALELSA